MLGAYAALGVGNLAAGESLALLRNPYVLIAVMVIAGGIVATVFSMLIERTIFRPLQKAKAADFVPVLATLGASMFIENAVFKFFGSSFNNFPIGLPTGVLRVAGARITVTQLSLIGATFVVAIGFQTFMTRTKVGTAMRAIAWDREVATVMGIDANRLVLLAFGLAGALAGAAGAFVAFYYGVITFFMGFSIAVSGFTAAVFGGFGSVWGALLGGLLLGVLQSFATIYSSGSWSAVISVIVLILVLLIRPTGIMGERLAVRA